MADFTHARQEIFEVRLEGYISIDGTAIRRWNNVHHFARDAEDPIDPEDLGAMYAFTFNVAEVCHAWWTGAAQAYSSEDWSLAVARAKCVQPFEGPFSDFASTEVGAATDPVDEPDDCMVLQKRTFGVGRRCQGRTYVSGIPDVVSERGLLEDGWTANRVAAFPTMIADGLDTDVDLIRWGVWSAKEYSISSDLDLAFNLVQAVTADRVVRRMESREFPFRIIAS